MNRTPLLLSTVVVAALAIPAGAAPAKSLCFQIKDSTGDASFNGTPLAPASLDVVSADIATGGKSLMAVVRLKSLGRDPYQASGTAYTFSFTLGGVEQTLTYAVSATGAVDSTYKSGPTATAMTAKAVTDPAAGTITWTVPRRSVQGLKTGAKLTGLEVTSAATVHVQQDGNSFSAASVSDTGSTSKAYTDGTKTCLKGV